MVQTWELDAEEFTRIWVRALAGQPLDLDDGTVEHRLWLATAEYLRFRELLQSGGAIQRSHQGCTIQFREVPGGYLVSVQWPDDDPSWAPSDDDVPDNVLAFLRAARKSR